MNITATSNLFGSIFLPAFNSANSRSPSLSNPASIFVFNCVVYLPNKVSVYEQLISAGTVRVRQTQCQILFGLLHIPGTKDTFAKMLLPEGLVRRDEYSPQEAAVLAQFRTAEEVAAEGAARKREYLNVIGANVEPNGSFSYVVLDESVGRFSTLTSTSTAQQPAALSTRPRKNDLVVYPTPGTYDEKTKWIFECEC
ncbi:uncharacterized protein V1513DRAFT_485739 [Lipomyces chichibuensis]|uniref:uncharacterized protein n=1 Tax=Lipomyces chichibuensis TaxID=1546026 RepID=UPI003343585E